MSADFEVRTIHPNKAINGSNKMSASVVSQTPQKLHISASDTTVCPELGAMVTRIVHKYTLRLKEIKFCFHTEFAFPMDLKKYDFKSIEELIDSLIVNDYPLEKYYKEGYCYVRTSRQYFYWLSGIKIKREFHSIDILADLPQDVISSGDQQLPPFHMPADIVVNGCPEIISGEIVKGLVDHEVRLICAKNPHHFYIHLCGHDFHNAYHRLRIDMRLYDKKENQNKYYVPCLLLSEGLLCAVRYKKICNEWHRCQLMSIDRDNNCRLFLLDIGDTIEAKASELRLLLKEFVKLPPQAIRAQLAGVRPKAIGQSKVGSEKKWSVWANNIIVRLEDHKNSGSMRCVFIDFKVDRYRVYLKFYDHFKSSDINDLLYLHEVLIDKGLALISANDTPID